MMKKNKIISFLLLGLVFFFFFLYKTFPYSLLKEDISLSLQQKFKKNNIPLLIKIDSLKPWWISGFVLSGVEIKNGTSDPSPFILETLKIQISPFYLLLGKFRFEIDAVQNKGILQTTFKFPIFSTILGSPSLSGLTLEAHKFSIKEAFSHLIGTTQSLNYANKELIEPLISVISLGGELNGKLDYNKGGDISGDLFVNDFSLNMNNPSLNLPPQHFSDAHAKFSWDGDRLTINKDDFYFKAQDISIDIQGYVEKSKNSSQASDDLLTNLNMRLFLSGEFEKSFGFLLPQLLKCPPSAMVDGVMKVKLVGPLSGPTCTT